MKFVFLFLMVSFLFSCKDSLRLKKEFNVVSYKNLKADVVVAIPASVFHLGFVNKQMTCFFCHVDIHGDIGAIGQNALNPHDVSTGTIYGNIYADNSINLKRVQLAPGFEKFENNKDDIPKKYLPKISRDGAVGFPDLTTFFKNAQLKNPGTVITNSNITIPSYYRGNLILDGKTTPLKISGEIFVDGDLIIRGVVEGQGTIYVSKNIFIPDNLTLKNSPRKNDQKYPYFTYDNMQKAEQEAIDFNLATQVVGNETKSKYDNLRLAAQGAIILGNVLRHTGFLKDKPYAGSYMIVNIQHLRDINGNLRYNPDGTSIRANVNTTLYMENELFSDGRSDVIIPGNSNSKKFDNFMTLSEFQECKTPYNGANFNVYSPKCDIYDHAFSQYKLHYEPGTWSIIEAFLYSNQGIVGNNRGSNIVVFGGFIAPYVDIIISGAVALKPDNDRHVDFFANILNGSHATDPNGIQMKNKITGLIKTNSFIEYDLRLKMGGSGFESIREFFEEY